MDICACVEYSTTKNEFAKFDKMSIYEHICNSCGKLRHHSAMGWLTSQFRNMDSNECLEELEKLFSNHGGITPLKLSLDRWDETPMSTRPLKFVFDADYRGPFPEHSLPVGVLLEEGEESTPAEILKEYWDMRLHNVGKITDNSPLIEVSKSLNKKIQRKK